MSPSSVDEDLKLVKIDAKSLGFGFLGALIFLAGVVLAYFMFSDPSGYFTGDTFNFAFLVTPFILIGLGVFLMVGGFGTAVEGEKKPQEKPLPTPPPPSSIVAPVCPVCGQPLTFIQQYSRWYCYNCKKYP